MTSVLDTAPATEATSVTEAASARATITPGDAWRKAKLPVVLGLLLIAVALLQAIRLGSVGAAYLDPDAAGPDGALALATLLRDHGVDVQRVSEPSGTPGTTVFVPLPTLVLAYRPGALSDLRTANEVVLAAPDEVTLELGRIDAGISGDVREQVLDPGCNQADAAVAGNARLGGLTFGAPETATACYVKDGEATFVELVGGGRRVTLLGTGAFMTNEHLDDNGNAALALRLLTRNPRVEWVYPRPAEIVEGADSSIFDLLPHRLFVLVAQALVVLLLLALWRARRLGPVVTEPLPVVVRAAEAVEGRARLYESARRRDQAANALRAGLRDRLVHVLGLAPDAGPDALVAAVTARTSRDSVDVTGLLYGPPPTDDAALVRLAAELDRLDTEVRAL